MGSSTKSGTPVETRGLSRGLAGNLQGLTGGSFEDLMAGLASPLNKAGGAGAMNLLGFDPRMVGTEAAVRRGLTDPSDAVAGLFGALAPLEARAQSEGLNRLMGTVGGAGARFGASATEAGGNFMADLMARQSAGREQALLQAQGQQNQLLGALMPSLTQAGAQGQNAQLQALQMILGFGAPGAPVIEQSPWGSIAGGLLGAGLGAFTGGVGTAAGAAAGKSLFGG